MRARCGESIESSVKLMTYVRARDASGRHRSPSVAGGLRSNTHTPGHPALSGRTYWGKNTTRHVSDVARRIFGADSTGTAHTHTQTHALTCTLAHLSAHTRTHTPLHAQLNGTGVWFTAFAWGSQTHTHTHWHSLWCWCWCECVCAYV